jgi:uncharacterized protein (TIGR01777 family)
MRVLMAGASGFLGTRLSRHLRAGGHEVVPLVRREAGPGEIRWDPAGGTLDASVLSTVDAVVNLAGANIGRPWTASYRRTLRSSRIDTTGTLARAIARGGERVAVLVNASGINYYGDPGDREVDETAPQGKGFLAELVGDWEAATAPAAEAGVRVVLLRTSPVLDAAGGSLKPFLLQFRLFAGGRLGDGRQYMPWIATPDWLAAVNLLIGRADIAGPVNMTSPAPVTNAEFSRALGRALHRPALLPTPAFVLRTALGEFSSVALDSIRALPGVLTRAGYQFEYSDVDSALRGAVDGWR